MSRSPGGVWVIAPATSRMLARSCAPAPERRLAADGHAARRPGAAAIGRDGAVAAHHLQYRRCRTPMVSAMICAMPVSVPWPWSVMLVRQRNEPGRLQPQRAAVLRPRCARRSVRSTAGHRRSARRRWRCRCRDRCRARRIASAPAAARDNPSPRRACRDKRRRRGCRACCRPASRTGIDPLSGNCGAGTRPDRRQARPRPRSASTSVTRRRAACRRRGTCRSDSC